MLSDYYGMAGQQRHLQQTKTTAAPLTFIPELKNDSVSLTADDISQEIVGYLCFIRIRTIRKIAGMFINIPKLMVDDLEHSDLHDSVWISRKQCRLF